MFRYGASVAMVATLLAGCGSGDGAAARRPDREVAEGAPARPQAATQTQVLVVLGTSLTAGLGLPPEQVHGTPSG